MRLVLRVLLIITIPLVLTMTMVRLVTMPWYPAWQYSRPGFPSDPLGMERGDRLRLARICIHFLNLPGAWDLLDDARLPDDSLAFNARELSHMDDVKVVYGQLTWVALVALLIALLAGWFLVRLYGPTALWGALSDGGLCGLVILFILGVWMSVGFSAFFTTFHKLFFEGDSWLFHYDDTLIRLFPLRFWSDAGMLIAILVGILSMGLALFGRALQKRGEREERSSMQDGQTPGV